MQKVFPKMSAEPDSGKWPEGVAGCHLVNAVGRGSHRRGLTEKISLVMGAPSPAGVVDPGGFPAAAAEVINQVKEGFVALG